jgi:single-strand DNA-binding protein
MARTGINKVILVGNLGGDPEVRETQSGIKVATLNMATTESYWDKNAQEKKERTEWHRVILWRGLADVADQYLKKGATVYIEGRLTTRSYEQDNITKYITEVHANQMLMLGGRSGGGGYGDIPPPGDDDFSGSSSESSSNNDDPFSDDDPFAADNKSSEKAEAASESADTGQDDDIDDLPF